MIEIPWDIQAVVAESRRRRRSLADRDAQASSGHSFTTTASRRFTATTPVRGRSMSSLVTRTRPGMTASLASMLRIDRITLREIRLALKEPFRISSGVMHERRIGLLELTDARRRDRLVRMRRGRAAELQPRNDRHRVARDPRVARAAGARSPARWPARRRTTCSRENIRGHNMAKAAVEMGCWGLAAEHRKRSALRHCSAARASACRRASRSAFSQTPDALVERARAAVAAGLSQDQDEDPARARRRIRARRARSARAGHRASWPTRTPPTRSTTPIISPQLDAFEPHHDRAAARRDDLAAPRRAAASHDDADLPRRVDHRRRSRRGHDRAGQRSHHQHQAGARRRTSRRRWRFTTSVADAGIPVWCGGMLESGIGRAYNVALASLPNFSLPGDLCPSARYWARDIVTPEWTMDADGMVHVPRRAGTRRRGRRRDDRIAHRRESKN